MSTPIMQQAGRKVLLMGNEAIARGAIEAGLELMAAYPGTPSSEICEALIGAAKENNYYVEWSTNEKVAFEVATGASLVGARSLVAMKNAGLNVAMDTFMTIPYGGTKGGMVVVVADDPDAHYSSNEQDTRFAAVYAEIPCLEPMDQQEAKDMTKAAFEISEALELPVFIRSVSRISHASGDVKLGAAADPRHGLGFNKHYKLPYRWNVYGPPGALHKHQWLHEQLPKAAAMANSSRFNTLDLVPGAKTGILCTGLAAAYGKEAVDRLQLDGKVSFLKLGFLFPLPEEMIRKLLQSVEEVLIVEEGDPVVEGLVRSLAKEIAPGVKIYGKSYNPLLKPYGELNTDIVANALAELAGVARPAERNAALRENLRGKVIPRSSTLCAGCSHLASYSALKEALRRFKGNHIVNGDIGCYEQGGYGIFSAASTANAEDAKKYPINSPYETLDTIYVMGSGIGLAQGQRQAGYEEGKVVAVAGDSTFFHATLPAIVNAAYNRADITLLIFDNHWTCMTGHQPNPNTGKTSLAEDGTRFDIAAAVRALGVEFVTTVDAYNRSEAVESIAAALSFAGPAVVILQGECQLQIQRRTKKGPARTSVDRDSCNGCMTCVRLGCPAIIYSTAEKKASIDAISCTDCTLCGQVCPQKAIKQEELR